LVGETLIFGIKGIIISSGNLKLQTSIASTRNFTSKSLNLVNGESIRAAWLLIVKNICSASWYYYPDLNKCGDACSIPNYVLYSEICMVCENPTCKICNTAQPNMCILCDQTTRTLNSTDKNCDPQRGYF